MYPVTIGPAPHILAGRDDRAAPRADIARGVRFVVGRYGAVIVTYRTVLRRGAQIFLQSLFDFQPAEIWWGCHARLPLMR